MFKASLKYAVGIIGAVALNLAVWSSVVAQISNPGVQQFGSVIVGHAVSWGPGLGQIQDGGTLAVGANPTAVAGPSAINGSAATFMRSDAAPAVQIATASQLGLAEADGTTLSISSGIMSVVQNYFTLTGNNTLSGNNTFSGSNLFTGAPATISAQGQATVGATSVNGAVMQGDGSSNDLSLEGSGGSVVCSILHASVTALNCNAFRPTFATPSGNVLYLPSANDVGIAANSVEIQDWAQTLTIVHVAAQFNSTINAPNIATTGTIAKAVCQDASGNFIANGTNCFSSGSGTVSSIQLSNGAGVAITPTSGTNPCTSTCNLTIAQSLTNATLQASPANPSGTASATGVMMGLGVTCHITPSYSGRINVNFIGNVQSSGVTSTATIKLYYGTGSAPANGAATTGTQIGPSVVTDETGTANLHEIYSNGGIITGLTPGTAYWFDIDLAASGGNTGLITNNACSAFEF